MNKILEIKNLSKVFEKNNEIIEAIKNISFDVYYGEFLAIVGPSGCGKSTLLNIISKLDKKTSGEINFDNSHIKIGYMLQDDALLPWLTIQENAILGLKIKNKVTIDNLKYVNNLLESFGLKDFTNKYPYELSGGMRQRVALIRTLALKPDILMLDEPFSALDYQTRIKISDDVKKITKKENITVVMITHDIAEAISLSDRITVLTKRPGNVKEIFKLNFDDSLSPLERRKHAEFNYFYEKIWQTIDLSI